MLTLHPRSSPSLPLPIQNKHAELLQTESSLTSDRDALQWRIPGVKSINVLTPAYDINYAMQSKHTTDKNKEKVILQNLNKQLKREQKGAMRELRRDAEFVEQEKFTALNRKKEALRAERIKNYSQLEQDQGVINLQVKIGKGDMIKGGGSTGAKKIRIK